MHTCAYLHVRVAFVSIQATHGSGHARSTPYILFVAGSPRFCLEEGERASERARERERERERERLYFCWQPADPDLLRRLGEGRRGPAEDAALLGLDAERPREAAAEGDGVSLRSRGVAWRGWGYDALLGAGWALDDCYG